MIYFPIIEWFREKYRYIRDDCLYIPEHPSGSRVRLWFGVLILLVIPTVFFALWLGEILKPYPIAGLSVGASLEILAYLIVAHKNKDSEKEKRKRQNTEAWWRGETAWYKFVGL